MKTTWYLCVSLPGSLVLSTALRSKGLSGIASDDGACRMALGHTIIVSGVCGGPLTRLGQKHCRLGKVASG
jgi:hypothetical protein